MPSPIKLQIKKKTKVPTKHQNVHLFRSDWVSKDMIGYNDSKNMFANIGTGPIENDSQFCKWLLDKFGEGIYLMIAWRKGKKGFWNFMKVELFKDKFRRLPKNLTPDEIEIRQEQSQLKYLKKNKISKSGDEREDIEDQIKDTEEYVNEVKKEIKKTKKGCYPYLKSCQPMYSWHSYETYEQKEKEEEFTGRMV